VNQQQEPALAGEFPFRGVRGMQAVLAASLVLILVGLISMVWVAVSEPAWPLLAPAVLLLLATAYLVFLLARLPEARVTISAESVSVRFPGAVHAAIPRANIVSTNLEHHRWWQGLGIRTDLRGTVMLATATGLCAEFDLSRPLRVWAIPRILPIRAKKLRVSVRDPERLVAYLTNSAPPNAEHQGN